MNSVHFLSRYLHGLEIKTCRFLSMPYGVGLILLWHHFDVFLFIVQLLPPDDGGESSASVEAIVGCPQ